MLPSHTTGGESPPPSFSGLSQASIACRLFILHGENYPRPSIITPRLACLWLRFFGLGVPR